MAAFSPLSCTRGSQRTNAHRTFGDIIVGCALRPSSRLSSVAARRASPLDSALRVARETTLGHRQFHPDVSHKAERADYPHAQLRENAMFVMEGLEAAAQAARIPTGSKIQVAYSLPPEGGSGFGDMVYATVPMGSVATKVASFVAFLWHGRFM